MKLDNMHLRTVRKWHGALATHFQHGRASSSVSID